MRILIGMFLIGGLIVAIAAIWVGPKRSISSVYWQDILRRRYDRDHGP